MAIDWSKLVYTQTATPYLDSYNKLANAYNQQAQTDVANMETRRDQDLTKSSAGYDNTARQNYINYMQAQKRLPSQLNALGIRGGASESSLIRLGTNYGTNVATNEGARQNAADSIRQAYAQQISDYNKDLNERLAQAEATAEQNQINWEREQLDKDLQYFSSAIEGLYKKRSDYQTLIKQLQASNDPNKDYKIMLATRAMNMIAASGGGGGGGRRSYGGGYNNNENSGNKDNNTKNGYTPYKYNKKAANTTAGYNMGFSSKKKTKTIKGDTYYVTSKGSLRAKK